MPHLCVLLNLIASYSLATYARRRGNNTLLKHMEGGAWGPICVSIVVFYEKLCVSYGWRGGSTLVVRFEWGRINPAGVFAFSYFCVFVA